MHLSCAFVLRASVDQDLAWAGELLQLGNQKVLTAMFTDMVQWYNATLPLELRGLVDAMERLTWSQGQPADPKELEQLRLAVEDCVLDGPPLQVAIFAVG